jgi:DNA-binding NtrC family response regulator
MPAHIVVVHDDMKFLGSITQLLRDAGHDAVGFGNPGSALAALVSAPSLAVLIVRIGFGGSQGLGLPLARVARKKHPKVQVLFVARPEYRRFALGIGAFIAAPAEVDDVVSTVQQMLIQNR